jgi:hypothetical protein
LLGDDATAARRAASELEASSRLDRGAPVRVVALAGTRPAGLPAGVLAAELEGRAVLVVPRPEAIGTVLGPLMAGVGSSVPAAQASVSLRQARIALDVAQHVPSAGPLAVWDDLGPFRLLDAATSSALRTAVVDDRVARILDEPMLRATASAYLDAAGSVARTAEALHVHRQTLYYRLGRIESLTGLDLGQGWDRLRLHLALTLTSVLF